MIIHYPYEHLGKLRASWLRTSYHFSFFRYYNPQRMGFGVLRVINDDVIKAGAGFDRHAHSDMEIITYVRSGAIEHEDSQGNRGTIAAGDIQVMSAGSGIWHSEYNMQSSDACLYQIWITPHTQSLSPSWSQCRFPDRPLSNGGLPLLVSGRKEDQGVCPLSINQYAALYGGKVTAGSQWEQPIKDQAYILVAQGAIEVGGHRVSVGDGCEVTELPNIMITALEDSEVLILDVPVQ